MGGGSLLLLTNTISANVIFPFLAVLAHKDYPYFFDGLIIASLVVEFLVFCWLLPHESRLKIAGVTMLMNIASALVGFVTLFFGDMVILGILSHLGKYWQEGTYFLIACYVTWIFVCILAVNTIIEFLVARFYFNTLNQKRIFLYIFLINLSSVSLSALAAFLHFYLYGPIKL